jgi:hypothetical protein
VETDILRAGIDVNKTENHKRPHGSFISVDEATQFESGTAVEVIVAAR